MYTTNSGKRLEVLSRVAGGELSVELKRRAAGGLSTSCRPGSAIGDVWFDLICPGTCKQPIEL
jgi:hypothetical protein